MIESCLRSLLRQSYPGLQVVAVDDRSTDRTGALLVRERYLQRTEDKAQALEQILGLNLPPIDWQSAEEEIEAAHHACLP